MMAILKLSSFNTKTPRYLLSFKSDRQTLNLCSILDHSGYGLLLLSARTVTTQYQQNMSLNLSTIICTNKLPMVQASYGDYQLLNQYA